MKVSEITIRRVRESHRIDASDRFAKALWTSALLTEHRRKQQRMRRCRWNATASSSREADRTRWRFLFLQEEKRDHHAGFAMAPLATKSDYAYVKFEWPAVTHLPWFNKCRQKLLPFSQTCPIFREKYEVKTIPGNLRVVEILKAYRISS